MKTFILILLVMTNETNLASQEFNSEATCNSAGRAATERFSALLSGVKYVCVEK